MSLRYRAFDLQFFGGEKTEPATPKRRSKAREEGQVAKSQDLTAASILLTGLFGLYLTAMLGKGTLLAMFTNVIEHLGSSLMFDDAWWARPVREGAGTFFLIWFPLALACFIVTIVVLLRQVKFKLSAKPLELKFDKFNPVKGMKKIISARSIIEMLKGLAKAGLLMFMLYRFIMNEQAEFMSIMLFPMEVGASHMMTKIWGLGVRMALVLLLIGFIDYGYQKWSFEKSIRMSKQDIKDEHKQSEGDPMIKSKIRQKQRELARSRMMSDVPKADVVVTNPTHVAVAIQYDANTMQAPVVLAKGVDFIAMKIRGIAEEHKIPIVEDPPLARLLLAEVEIGESIPQEMYRAVAEVLAFVYRLKNKRAPAPAAPKRRP